MLLTFLIVLLSFLPAMLGSDIQKGQATRRSENPRICPLLPRKWNSCVMEVSRMSQEVRING